MRHTLLALQDLAAHKFIRVFTDNTSTAAVLNTLYSRSPTMRAEVLAI